MEMIMGEEWMKNKAIKIEIDGKSAVDWDSIEVIGINVDRCCLLKDLMRRHLVVELLCDDT
jgi:hypothetical protein